MPFPTNKVVQEIYTSKKHYNKNCKLYYCLFFTFLTAVTSFTVEGHRLLSLGKIYRLFHFEQFLSIFRLYIINFVDCSYKFIIDTAFANSNPENYTDESASSSASNNRILNEWLCR